MKDLMKFMAIVIAMFVIMTMCVVDRTTLKNENLGIYSQTTFENVGINRIMRIDDTYNAKTGEHNINYQLMSYQDFFSLLKG